MNASLNQTERAPDLTAVATSIRGLVREASIELNVQDVKHLAASRDYLRSNTRLYVSHLPKQTWQATIDACREVREAGFEPIPHLPVRLLEDSAALERLLEQARRVGVEELLLIAGDYASPRGPYPTVADVLRTRMLSIHGINKVSFAGHPEGHPRIELDVIRAAEIEKASLAADAGLDATFVTQFFFEARPFLDWVETTRAAGVTARLIGGLCGPASAATLFKYALRCGVGPSIRALGAKPASFMKLLGDHGPEQVVRELADSRANFDGVHFFCFGGYLRTCEWLRRVAEGSFTLNDHDGFDVF